MNRNERIHRRLLNDMDKKIDSKFTFSDVIRSKSYRNKLTRKLKEQKLFNKRLKRLNLTGKHYCYKAQTRPCSCPLCKNDRYSRKEKHRKDLISL